MMKMMIFFFLFLSFSPFLFRQCDFIHVLNTQTGRVILPTQHAQVVSFLQCISPVHIHIHISFSFPHFISFFFSCRFLVYHANIFPIICNSFVFIFWFVIFLIPPSILYLIKFQLSMVILLFFLIMCFVSVVVF